MGFAPPPRGGFAFVAAPERQYMRGIVLPRGRQVHLPGGHFSGLKSRARMPGGYFRRRPSQHAADPTFGLPIPVFEMR
jgi:hypothetical protein